MKDIDGVLKEDIAKGFTPAIVGFMGYLIDMRGNFKRPESAWDQ